MPPPLLPFLEEKSGPRRKERGPVTPSPGQASSAANEKEEGGKEEEMEKADGEEG
jgi:hypothetical protein